jgi:hypothetical protein
MAAPKKAMPKPKGRASIYKGTDKTTNTKDRVRNSSQKVVYANGSTKRLVTASQQGKPVVKAEQNAYVISQKKGNTIETRLNSNDPYVDPRGGYIDRFPRAEMKTTTLGNGGRRESIVRRSGQNQSPSFVVSETQLNRGSGTRKTGAKNKGY